MRRRGAAEAAPLHIVAGNPLYAAPFRGTIAAKPPETGAIREGTSCIIVSASAGGRICTRKIEAYVKAHHIAAGAVVSGVGCVSRWRLRDATGVRVRSGEEDVEIVSLMGTVSEYGCHLHASFSREDLSAFGGHLLPGCTVNTTAEIVLAEIRSCVFTRRPDSETGYEELEIGPAYPEETRNDRREER